MKTNKAHHTDPSRCDGWWEALFAQADREAPYRFRCDCEGGGCPRCDEPNDPDFYASQVRADFEAGHASLFAA